MNLDWSVLKPDWPVLSLIVALLALYIARSNYRRSNYVIVRVLNCELSTSYAAGGGAKTQFKVFVQNVGIPIHNIQMVLGFHGPGYCGWCSVPMKAGDSETREGQFAKGAITDFSLSLDELDLAGQSFMSTFDHTGMQTATLTLYADKYRVWEYRLHGFRRKLKRLWNRLGEKVNHKLKRKVGPGAFGKGVFKFYTILPPLVDPAQKLWEFSRYVKKPDPTGTVPGTEVEVTNCPKVRSGPGSPRPDAGGGLRWQGNVLMHQGVGTDQSVAELRDERLSHLAEGLPG